VNKNGPVYSEQFLLMYKVLHHLAGKNMYEMTYFVQTEQLWHRVNVLCLSEWLHWERS